MTKADLIYDLLWACRKRCGKRGDECSGCRLRKYQSYSGIQPHQPNLLALTYKTFTEQVTTAAIEVAESRTLKRVWWSEVKLSLQKRGIKPCDQKWWSILSRSSAWRAAFVKTGSQRPSPLATHNGSAEQEWALKAA